MKRILNISLMMALVTGTFILVSFADRIHHAQRLKTFTIDILNSSDDALITEKELRDLIEEEFGRIEGAMITTVNLDRLEEMVRDNPYIAACEVYRTIGGDLRMLATVRSPLVRVMNDSGQQYFIDRTGFMVPVTNSHPSHVVVASGNISERLVMLDRKEKPLSSLPDSSVLRQIYPVAMMISKDSFLESFIDQIYVNEKKELELVPKIGTHEIIFGTAENAAEKLENLKTFYQKVMNKLDWNTYKTINLKYTNQVICLKKSL
jgi:cell division protein FtsQ